MLPPGNISVPSLAHHRPSTGVRVISEDNQQSNGFTAVPNDILKVLLCSDLSDRERSIILLLLRLTAGFRQYSCSFKNKSQIGQCIGVDRSNIYKDLDRMVKKNIIFFDSDTNDYVLNYNVEQWDVKPATAVIDKVLSQNLVISSFCKKKEVNITSFLEQARKKTTLKKKRPSAMTGSTAKMRLQKPHLKKNEVSTTSFFGKNGPQTQSYQGSAKIVKKRDDILYIKEGERRLLSRINSLVEYIKYKAGGNFENSVIKDCIEEWLKSYSIDEISYYAATISPQTKNLYRWLDTVMKDEGVVALADEELGKDYRRAGKLNDALVKYRNEDNSFNLDIWRDSLEELLDLVERRGKHLDNVAFSVEEIEEALSVEEAEEE